MIRDPRASPARTDVYVTLIDMYRTLAELAGTPAPEPGVVGRSVAGSVLPDGTAGAADFQMAFAQVARCVPESVCDAVEGDPTLCAGLRQEVPLLFQIDDACTSVARERIDWMGYTVRVPGWRYTAWVRFGPQLVANWSVINATELYAHGHDDDGDDFDSSETSNVARDEANAEVVRELHSMLIAHFGPPTPPGPPQSPPSTPPRPQAPPSGSRPPPVAGITGTNSQAAAETVATELATLDHERVSNHAQAVASSSASSATQGLAAATALLVLFALLCSGRLRKSREPAPGSSASVELSASSSSRGRAGETHQNEGVPCDEEEICHRAGAAEPDDYQQPGFLPNSSESPPTAASVSTTRRKRRSRKKARLPPHAVGSEELPAPPLAPGSDFADCPATAPNHDDLEATPPDQTALLQSMD